MSSLLCRSGPGPLWEKTTGKEAIMVQYVVAEYGKVIQKKTKQTLVEAYNQIFKVVRGWGEEALKEAIREALEDGLAKRDI